MNQEAYLQELIDAIKADKSIVQPWRNYSIKVLNEAQAFVRMGKTTTYAEVPQDASMSRAPVDTFLAGKTIADPSAQATAQKSGACTCPPGGIKRTCPVHGGNV